MLNFLTIGAWREPDVHASARQSSRHAQNSDIESQIERLWKEGRTNPQIHLFDGPMCRLESFQVAGGKLRLELSSTSYRVFFGTNLRGNVAQIDPRCRANPLGVSAGLISADRQLMLGHRNNAVAYYPNRIHPFAGTFEPRDEGN